MTFVQLKPGESFESLLRRFKRAVEDSGILSDLKKTEFYEKPSVRRKKKHIIAVKKLEKQQRPKPRNLNFKWNRNHTKKLPLKPNYRGDKPTKAFGNSRARGRK